MNFSLQGQRVIWVSVVFEQLDLQEETSAISTSLNNSSNVSGMKKFINEKNCETFLNKSVKCGVGSQQNFFNKILIIKLSKHSEQNLSSTIISLRKILFNLKPIQKMMVPKELFKAIKTALIKLI